MTDPDLQQKRLVAAAIDAGVLIAVCLLMSGLLAVLGFAVSQVDLVSGYGMGLAVVVMALACLAYVLARDVLAGGRSLGKKISGIRVVTETGAPIGLMESVRRNALFAPPFVLWVFTALIELLPLGSCVTCLMLPLQLLAALVALAATIYEFVQIAQHPEGLRVGDKMAGTRVVR